MSTSISARKLRVILSAALIPLIAIGAGVFMLGYRLLGPVAQQTSDAATQAQQSSQEQDNLRRTQTALIANHLAVQRAKDIVATSKSYQYQNQITKDVYRLAAAAGIGVTGITFASTAAAASTPAATPTPGTPTAPSTSAAPGGGGVAAPIAPAGTKTASATIALASPMPYEKFLLFLYSIEQNSTKMRIESVSLSSASSPDDKKANGVSSDALTIEVYLNSNE